MTVNADDVTRVLDSTTLSDSDINDFINAARRAYTQRIDGEAVDADEQDDVVTRLAAHLIATGPERQISSGDGISFEGETGDGLRATTHGQMATLLDPTGQLAGDADGDSDHFTLST